MGDLQEPNGVVLEDSVAQSSSSSSSRALVVGPEVWAQAEQASQEIIRQVQPTVVSEERRRDVVDYVQRLLKCYLGCEVFPFGSVPLKTYLPDGDIDLTAFCGFNVEETFANNVYSVLDAEDHNPAAEFVVKDVQYIRAEVKLVKCLVQNIVVDISFNQIGGLCALCFLEEVDRLIGKDHLFKRSIILIKAWCYYESRILGAHHGLISTYALETLVLYIFHLFHSSLSGPLAVLYKFLDYFSKFDWENYCVSLSGPVHLSSLPEIVAERPENGGGELLLSDEFMRECVRKFSVPSRGTETTSRTFMQKHLNIVDPLKENNNLGRSVSRGNFYRIRSAFSFGARKLGHILSQPQENVAGEVRGFFTNTLDRHGQGQRPDVQDNLLMPECNDFAPERLLSAAEPSPAESFSHEVGSLNSSDCFGELRVGSEDVRHVGSHTRESGSDSERADVKQEVGMKKSIPSTMSSPAELFKEEVSSSGSRLSGDANDLATCAIQDLRMTDHTGKSSSVAEDRRSSLGNIPHAPHLYFHRHLHSPQMENGDWEENQPTDACLSDRRHRTSKKVNGCHKENTFHKDNSFNSQEQENSQLCNNRGLFVSVDTNSHNGGCLRDSNPFHRNTRSPKMAESHETPNLLPDLSGEVDRHLDSLLYGRWWYDPDHFSNISFQTIPLPPSPLFHRKNQWDTIPQSVHFRRDMVPHVAVNGVVPRPAFFPMSPPVVTGAGFGVEEMPKTRGTGTYFPITNHHSYRERSLPGKGRTMQGSMKSPRTNGRTTTPFERSPQAHSPGRQGFPKPRFPDSRENSPRGKVFKEVNGFVHTSEKPNELNNTLDQPIPESPLPEKESNKPPPDSGSPPGSENRESVFIVSNDRLSVQSYRLKDDEDFPPLSI